MCGLPALADSVNFTRRRLASELGTEFPLDFTVQSIYSLMFETTADGAPDVPTNAYKELVKSELNIQKSLDETRKAKEMKDFLETENFGNGPLKLALKLMVPEYGLPVIDLGAGFERARFYTAYRGFVDQIIWLVNDGNQRLYNTLGHWQGFGERNDNIGLNIITRLGFRAPAGVTGATGDDGPAENDSSNRLHLTPPNNYSARSILGNRFQMAFGLPGLEASQINISDLKDLFGKQSQFSLQLINVADVFFYRTGQIGSITS
jgi:hypothetical protein